MVVHDKSRYGDLSRDDDDDEERRESGTQLYLMRSGFPWDSAVIFRSKSNPSKA